MERTLAMFLKENPFDYDAEQLCRLKQEIDHPQDGRGSDERIDYLLWQQGQKSRQESFCRYVVRNLPCRRYPHLLEVGCGRQARLSQLLAQQGYQMSAIDPKLYRVPAHVEGIVACFHHERTPISSYDAVIAQEPCDATEHIVRSCIREQKDFVISLCAEAHRLISGEQPASIEAWYRYLLSLDPAHTVIICPSIIPGYVTPVMIGRFR